jgi:hypothetical protein
MMKKLIDIPDKKPFKVPDNYFEELNSRIISATSGIEQEAKQVKMHSRFRTSFLIAASFAGFILIGYTTLKLLAPDKNTTQVSEVIHEINPDAYINDIDISSLEEDASSIVLSEEGTGVSKKDIIDYLMLDNIEINDIYEQL